MFRWAFFIVIFVLLLFFVLGILYRFVENKREAGELAEKEGRKLKPEDYLYQYAGMFVENRVQPQNIKENVIMC